MRLHLGSDHGGIALRRSLAAAAVERGDAVGSEQGPSDPTDSVDYPDVAFAVCGRVLADPGSLGVLVCGTGQGMAMAANKLAGIRAAVVVDPFSARMAREHNDANVLCLGERVLGTELAKMLLEEFLRARYTGGRHTRRVAKIDRAGG